MSTSPLLPPQEVAPPFDPALLARLATELFTAPPFSPRGAQPPANLAPPGSPLAGPAGMGQGVPGTAIPQGLAPGVNLLPSSPHQVLTLGNRAPALAPAAQAGNGVPDKAISALPAYEPRLGGVVLGVPQSLGGNALPAPIGNGVGDSVYYFRDDTHGHPQARTAAGPTAAPVAATATPASSPQFYFVHSVQHPNGYLTPAKGDPHPVSPPGGHRQAGFDVHAVRRDFPILQERINGRPLVWLDNAATTHKPQVVIDRLSEFYRRENSNIHRAAHELAARATDAYEGARERVRSFINAPDVSEVIFVRGTTEAINLVAKSWGVKHVGAGDEIVVSHLEHHANIVPW